MPNPFANWTAKQVAEHNARVKAAAEPPKFYGDTTGTYAEKTPQAFATNLVIRKSTDEEKLNKLEKAWLWELRRLYPPAAIGIQNITLKLADDTRYTPDFNIVNENGELVFYETKGPRFWDDAKVKLKVAARMFLYCRFVLVTRDKRGLWFEHPVKP